MLKALARRYHTAVSNYDAATVASMIREDYVQHNPKVPTGRAAFVGLLPQLEAHQTKIQNVRMLTDGRYVAMQHLWTRARPLGAAEMAAFHIIRFDADDLIAEHWSVMAELAPLNPSRRSLLDGETTIRDLDRTELNKEVVATLLGKLIEARLETTPDAMAPFLHPGFRQHRPLIADGLQTNASAGAPTALRIDYQKQHRFFGDGNFVLSVSEGAIDARPTALYDLLRLEDGLVIEHWSIYQGIPTEGVANDNTMFNFK
jgi:predicted SnoaL-like aldol condensation-catalyzing enzyme